MKPMKTLAAGLLLVALGAGSAFAELRTWTDFQGRQVTATFVKIEGEHVVLQSENGALHQFPLTKLSAEDQAVAKAMTPAESAPAAPQMLANATVAQAAQKIDQLVANGLIKANAERVKMPGKAPIKSFNPL